MLPASRPSCADHLDSESKQRYAIEKLHLNKACGSDAVYALNIKTLHLLILVPLLAMCFNSFFSH